MLKSAQYTDVGLVRSVNEDRAVICEMAGCTLAIVADGMGGHQAGDTASQMTVEMLRLSLQSLTPDMPEEERSAALEEAIRQANATVFEMASKKEHYHGMGTTVTAALTDGKELMIGHIGDSRAYIINPAECRQLTEDHTLVNELVKTGQISLEEAATHPRRNVLTRALGTDEEVEVDLIRCEWQEGDVLLLCSDGLSNHVTERVMQETLLSGMTLQEKAEFLVERALEAGGDDNITVVLMANEQQ